MEAPPLPLPRFGLGNWNAYDGSTDNRQIVELLACAHELGVRLLDTADLYQDGEAEAQLGRALARFPRDTFLVATKGGGAPDGTVRGGRAELGRALEGSLRRLGRDHIDLYQVHHRDPHTPLEETLAALDEFRARGLVRTYGCCNYEPLDLLAAADIAERAGHAPFSTVQVRFNALERDRGDVVFPFARAAGARVIAYSVLAEGLLTGRYRHEVAPGSRAARDPSFAPKWLTSPWRERADAFVDDACSAGFAPEDLAVAFVARDPRVDVVLLGARTPAQLTRAVSSCVRAPVEAVDAALGAIAAREQPTEASSGARAHSTVPTIPSHGADA